MDLQAATNNLPATWDWQLQSAGGRVQLVGVDGSAGYRRERREMHDLVLEELGRALDVPVYGPTDWDLWADECASGGRITGWSAKSRSNLLRQLAGVRIVGSWAMVTLTLPGNGRDGTTWADFAPDPRAFRELRHAFERRWDRRYGELRGVWKLEFQRRGAPHLHYGVQLPDGVPVRSVREFVVEAWHEVVCHPGRGNYCDPQRCAHRHHGLVGAAVDASFGDDVRTAGKSFAAYFAKHGVWRSKDYQNDNGNAAAVAAGWEFPGRWWGFTRLSVDDERGDQVDGELAAMLRLVARKVTVRRTWRYVIHEGRAVLVRRELQSTRGHRGFWLLSGTSGELLAAAMLAVAVELAELRNAMPPELLLEPGWDGRQARRRWLHLARARRLAEWAEPGARPRPGRDCRRAVPLSVGALSSLDPGR